MPKKGHVQDSKSYNCFFLDYRDAYIDDETQHSRAAKPLIRYSPAPVAQQPTIKGAPKGPFEDAQQPEPYIAASPTRPPTCGFYKRDQLDIIYSTKRRLVKKYKCISQEPSLPSVQYHHLMPQLLCALQRRHK